MRKLRPRGIGNLPTFIYLQGMPLEFIPKASALNHPTIPPFYLTQATWENRTARVITSHLTSFDHFKDAVRDTRHPSRFMVEETDHDGLQD